MAFPLHGRMPRLGHLALGAAAAIILPTAAQAQVSVARDPADVPTGGQAVALCVANGFVYYHISDDCGASLDPYLQPSALQIGPIGSSTIFDAHTGEAEFDGGATFNSGVQFNGGVAFTGVTTANQLNSGSINNSGTISTGGLNTGTLHASGNGTFTGALSSDSFYANSATIAALHVPGAATFDSSVSVGGSLTARDISISSGLVLASGATFDAGGNRIQNVGAPVAATDAANRAYVDASIQQVQSGVSTLGAQVSDHETRITAIEAVNGQQDAHLAAIDTRDAAQDSHLAAIDAVNAGQDSRLTAIEAVNNVQSQQIGRLQDQVGGLQTDVAGLHRDMRRANAGIAAAVALGGTMVVPDSNVSISFNLATYRGEQAYSGSVVGRISKKVYVQAGFGGSTQRGSTAGRIGFTFGL